ncbi:MAG: hypothetical protein NT135_01875 [Candidatus Berkelbacteria bacterium]|nr:hypothetical protein [Candidatus Berkelbacteria bacterium]
MRFGRFLGIRPKEEGRAAEQYEKQKQIEDEHAVEYVRAVEIINTLAPKISGGGADVKEKQQFLDCLSVLRYQSRVKTQIEHTTHNAFHDQRNQDAMIQAALKMDQLTQINDQGISKPTEETLITISHGYDFLLLNPKSGPTLKKYCDKEEPPAFKRDVDRYIYQ